MSTPSPLRRPSRRPSSPVVGAAARAVRVGAALLLTAPVLLVGLGAGPAHADEADTAAGTGDGQLVLPADAPVVESHDLGAPAALVAGWSRAELGPTDSDESSLFYRYRREIPGSTVHVSVTSPGYAIGADDQFRVQVSAPDGDDCGTESATRFSGERTLLNVALAVGAGDPAADETSAPPCADTTEVRVAVDRSSTTVEETSPIWVRVVEESPVDDVDGLPRARERAEVRGADVDGDPVTQAGGRGVVDAPLVEPGLLRGTVGTGEQVAYRVRLGWGQTLVAEAVAGGLSQDELDEVGFGRTFAVSVLSPLLSAARTETATASLSADPTTSQSLAGPVGYLNRYDDLSGPFLPGEYLVVVAVAGPSSSEDGEEDVAVDVDYTLRLEVDGEADDPPAYTEDPPLLLAEGEAGDEVAAGAGDVGGAGASVARYVTGGALLAGGLVAFGAGLVLVRRRPQAVRSR